MKVEPDDLMFFTLMDLEKAVKEFGMERVKHDLKVYFPDLYAKFYPEGTSKVAALLKSAGKEQKG